MHVSSPFHGLLVLVHSWHWQENLHGAGPNWDTSHWWDAKEAWRLGEEIPALILSTLQRHIRWLVGWDEWMDFCLSLGGTTRPLHEVSPFTGANFALWYKWNAIALTMWSQGGEQRVHGALHPRVQRGYTLGLHSVMLGLVLTGNVIMVVIRYIEHLWELSYGFSVSHRLYGSTSVRVLIAYEIVTFQISCRWIWWMKALSVAKISCGEVRSFDPAVSVCKCTRD